MHLRTAVIPLVLLLIVGSSPALAEAEVWRQPLGIADGLPLVSVWVGDRGPWRFAIDTGAEGSSVSRTLAARLALPAAGAIDDHTMTGARRVPVVRVAGLRLGHDGPDLATLHAAVVDVDRLRPSAGTIDGVLGGDALGGFDYALDFAARLLTIARGEALPRGSRRDALVLSLRFERNRPIVDWPRDRSAAPLMLVLDTGSDALIVDRQEADTFPCRPRTELAMRLETHAGSREVQSCEVASLATGALDVSGLRLVAVTWPTAMARLDRGLLPASAFGRIEVSASDGTLTVWPR